jgi:hypothetical protein
MPQLKLGVFIVGALFLAAPQAKADVIYTYTGKDFTFVDPLPGPYKTTDFVSGNFNLTSALGANLSNFNVLTDSSFISFSFSDGVNTITNSASSFGIETLTVSTNALGQITSWDIDLQTPSDANWTTIGQQQFFIVTSTLHQQDMGQLRTCDPPGDCSINNDAAEGSINNVLGGFYVPGSWVETTPLPATLPLFATGLGGLGLLGWRRKRRPHTSVA